ncbi:MULTISPECIES: FHA domain-containing protein [Nocardia]|uniref:FHA domain-containing protein n=1 Tax=Nocardia implantans TaxID=3108168 RepID=A0ABU6APW0_9NOCA|nr:MULTISPECIES: FHA domain-containing protein [unclassified Nocardia]MBF6189833.1 FHA domain-containing protein [Nocardia beijingensis]MEA3526934.1 FHA domain-containing protein [Nocardia sp. CDC192]MEB3509488.1 FHA domain-containing protein [Nocardia sp. CDC186]
MRRQPSTVGIAPGDGLVARFGAVVAYLGAETTSTDRILGTIEAVAEGEHPGAALAQRLAAVIFGSTVQPPPFGVVAPTADGVLILLRGPVTAEIQGAEGARRLDGGRAFTWVDEIVREPVRRITIGAGTGAPPTALPRTDLRSGVVPGGGFVLHAAVRRAGKPAGPRTSEPSAQGEPEPTAAAGFAAMPEPTGAADAVVQAKPGARQTGTSDAVAQATPAPRPTSAADAVAPARPTESSRPLVKPRPPRPVPDRPLAWSQVQPAHEPVALRKAPDNGGTRGLRQAALSAEATVGALVTEEGAAYPLDRAYVIGRGPQVDEAVRTAAAEPIVIQRDRHVSRVHAYVSVDGGKVYIRDAAATSGTFIAGPGTDQWTRISTSPTELPPGWRVRISERVLTHRGDTQRTGTTDIAGARRRS